MDYKIVLPAVFVRTNKKYNEKNYYEHSKQVDNFLLQQRLL